ncbi:hypothetical protein HPP92_019622 [Vanilla planifolia]|uniref:Uncharacterized protein n=1 Tax=Vanilla planifolia TaxID=51239 RepID=A0A835UL44_VANPL|nr:hypothetical protein HPP92_019622 [Vanilla planifolia]
MLRRRSGPTEAQSKDQSMGNLNSISSVSEATTEHRTRTSSFFSFPGLLVSTTSKGSPESDSTKSPTSPLDFRLFTSLGSFLFRSPRSPGRSWDCSRVGLGLVDSLGGETCPGLSENRNLLLGSQKRILTQNDVSSNQVSSFSATAASRKHFVDPEPISGVLGSLPPREIELSEDYTCIISHGPNPKTTHIFGNCILESCVIKPPAIEGGRTHSFPQRISEILLLLQHQVRR